MAEDYYSATPDVVARGVIRYWTSRRDDEFDAVDAFLASQESEPQRAWDIALAIIQLTDDPDHLGQLGAGAIETLLHRWPEWALSRLRVEVPVNSRLAETLTDVRLDRDDVAFDGFVDLVRTNGLSLGRYISLVADETS